MEIGELVRQGENQIAVEVVKVMESEMRKLSQEIHKAFRIKGAVKKLGYTYNFFGESKPSPCKSVEDGTVGRGFTPAVYLHE